MKNFAIVAFGLSVSSCVSAQCQPPALLDSSIRVELVPVVSSLNGQDEIAAPTALTFPKDGSGRLFWGERFGTIHVAQNGVVLPTPMLDIKNEVLIIGSRGLLGLELHPGFADSGSLGYRRLYTWHSVWGFGVTPDYALANKEHQNILTEWRVSVANPNVVDVATRRELLRVDHAHPAHSGGGITFDNDGYLYLTIGTPMAPTINGQDNTHPDGCVLRIDPLDPALTPGSPNPLSKNGKFRIPADNPFVGSPTLAQEIFAWGLRHPFSLSHDVQTDAILVADVGQEGQEELNYLVGNSNYGWPYWEGYCAWTVPLPTPAPTLTDPVLAYDQALYGRSIIAGEVYRGSAIPPMQGLYFFIDFSNSPSGFYEEPGTLFVADVIDQNGAPKGTKLQINRLQVGRGGDKYDMNTQTCAADENGEVYIAGVISYTSNKEAAIMKVTPLECYGDCDGSGSLDFFDFLCFQNYFATGKTFADCDLDGSLTFFDFLCFQNEFALGTGCP